MNNCSVSEEKNGFRRLTFPMKSQISKWTNVQPPRISVVVPNLNEAKYLRKFLMSLVHQEYRDFEIIMVDGGSTDGSLEIAEEFSEDLLRGRLFVVVDRKRNIGYIRNCGSEYAAGELLFHTSSDVMLDPWLLWDVNMAFDDLRLIALTGRTKPVGSQVLCHVAYQSFDLLRWFFTVLPGSLRKFRPGGNFLAVRRNVFMKLAGFPQVQINEDGLLGQKIDEFLAAPRGSWAHVKFNLRLCVHHHVKRFEQRGSIKTILFYLYVLGNMVPMLKPLLYKLEAHSAEIFKDRSDLRNFNK